MTKENIFYFKKKKEKEDDTIEGYVIIVCVMAVM